MNKSNVVRSSEFFMATGDVLHYILIVDSGATPTIDIVSVGTIDNSNDVPDAVVALDASDITSSSFTANWSFIENSSGYYLDVATDSAFTSFVAGYNNLSVGYVNERAVVGLGDAIEYFYRVRAINDNGTGDNSNIITVGSINKITLTTTTIGVFSVTLDGSGDIRLDFGDGTIEDHTLIPATYEIFTHSYIGGGTLNITGISNITYISAVSQNLTGAVVSEVATNIEQIHLSNNALTTFDTHAEWVNLTQLNVQSNNLSSLDTHTEWVNLLVLAGSSNNINSIDTFASWVDLVSITFAVNNIVTVNTFAAWVDLEAIDFSENLLTAITLRPEWTKLLNINLHDNYGLLAVDTYATWVDIQSIELTSCPIGSINTYNTWVDFYRINVYDAGLVTFEAHQEWNLFLTIQIDARENDIVLAADINNILIEIDNSTKTTGFIYLEGGTNAAPTGAGITAKNSLIAKGITVTTN